MKHALLPLIVTLFSTGALAQPTLTNATSVPAFGAAYNYNNNDITDPGASGAGVTWDFSAASSSSNYPGDYEDCSTAPDCDVYPGTTIVFNRNSGANYVYIMADASVASILGLGGALDVDFGPNPEDVFHFPFTYLDSYIDTFSGTYTLATVDVYRKGTVMVEGDAWGTLTTPVGTYSNVLRVHRHEDITDSTILGNVTITNDIYAWYNTDTSEFLFNIQQSTSSLTGSDTTAQWIGPAPAGVSGLSMAVGNLNIFPQPAYDQATISFTNNEAAELSVSLTDVLGRKLMSIPARHFAAGRNQVSMDLSGVPAGLYMITVSSNGQKVASQKLQIL